MDLNKCSSMAEGMAAKAIKQDSLILDGVTYNFRFKPLEWVYCVEDSDGNFIANFNTKKITQAKAWLKDYLKS
jgi:hypothetical protein